MKKVFKIAAIVIAVLLVAGYAVMSYTSKLSPPATVENTHNGLNVKVVYCQPYKKGRVIFGDLVPYGEVWRTGANESTKISFGQDVNVAGKPIPKGDYTLWTIPTATGWTAIFNKETGQWGTSYDEKEDVLRVPIVSQVHSPMAEQFTMAFAPNGNGTDLKLFWDQTEAIIPITR